MRDKFCGLETMSNLLKDSYVAHSKPILCHGHIESSSAIRVPGELAKTVKAGVIKSVNTVAVEMSLIP